MWLIFESAMQTRRVWIQRPVPRARGKVFIQGKTPTGRRMVSQNHWNAGSKGLLESRSSAPARPIPVEGICSGLSQPGWRSTAFLEGVPSLCCDKDLPSTQPELPQGQPVATAPSYSGCTAKNSWAPASFNCPWRSSGGCEVASQPPLCQAKQAQLPQPSPASPCRPRASLAGPCPVSQQL